MPLPPGVVDWLTAHPRVLLGLFVAGWAAVEYRSTLGHALDGRRDQLWWLAKYVLVVAGGYAVGRLVLAPVWADLTTQVEAVLP